ncbi:MAG: hypothetical protein LBR10_13130 [Prevotellaceae bacterium]|jgi:hypothetical protein|nr:hypothetical protein [Prevotellaceae bacterium]
MAHYLIISIIIIIIVYYQFLSYFDNKQKLTVFREIFPKNRNSYTLNHINNQIGLVANIKNNEILKVIINSINEYLDKNKGAVGDFHIIKDVVDRNCDAAEEEINAQIPVPLYYGLMGTMFGILVGLGFLVFSGGLNALLGSTTANGAGIQALLGGVALAMITSILGILLTTSGSMQAKNAKASVEKDKNIFLSWVQAELLPNLSSDVFGALGRMTNNLVNFNATFSSNTIELRNTLQQVNESYKGQAEILEAINNLKIRQIATANIEVYDKLQNCTYELDRFVKYLENVNIYIADVRALNDKLDKNETRTKAIEDMGTFFRQEKAIYEERKGAINRAVGQVDSVLKDAFNKLTDSVEKQFSALQKATVTQTEKLNNATVTQTENLNNAIEEQQRALQKKLAETSIIIDELKNLTAVKDSISKLEKATAEQSKKLDKLAYSIIELARAKVSGKSVEPSMPRRLKIFVIVGGSVVIAYCLYSLVFQILLLI